MVNINKFNNFIPKSPCFSESIVEKCSKLTSSQRLAKIFTPKDKLLTINDVPDISLTAQEKSAISSYLFDNVNPWLRVRHNEESSKVKVLDSLIERVPPLKDDYVVYRAIKNPRFERVKEYLSDFYKGGRLNDKCYSSTSCELNGYAKDHLLTKGSILLRIELPKGTKGIYFKDWKEFILPRNNYLDVNEIDGIGHCSYILPAA